VLAARSLESDGELIDPLGVVDVVPPVRPADEAKTGTSGAPCLDVTAQVVAQLVGFDPKEGGELLLDRRSSLGADHGQSGADTSDGDFPRAAVALCWMCPFVESVGADGLYEIVEDHAFGDAVAESQPRP
jgi:hypothetical protein